MVFSSMLFLWIFLPLVLAAYYISPRKIRNGILVFFSLLFYAWGEPVYIFLMLFSVGVNFAGGILIEKNPGKKKKILIGTVCINLALLGYFKYFSTLVEAISGIFASDGDAGTVFQVALPIGISFYTFQAMSYVIDVYRGETKAQHNFWHMLLYSSFFPQLIAGPIVKYKDIAAQITGRKETVQKFAEGVMRFCWGLGKKVILANSFAKVVDDIFKYGPYAVSRKALWLGAILYMLQIYYDFSGYSDMAIGLGKMFGFEFQENFRYPYVARSVQEFWRRWHISLSSWFRDYVYIPLGGNREGTVCTYRNLLIVFFLTGMWHGAGMAFLLWGLYYGLFLILERAGFGKKLEKLPKAVGWGYTMVVVFFGWILFRAENLSLFFAYVRNLFVSHGGIILLSAYLDRKMILLMVFGVLFAGILQKLYEKCRSRFPGKIPEAGVVTVPRILACAAIFWICVTMLVNNSYNPFIYFRF
ncbi:MBOAT family O-acyltransferase [Blautia sp.]